MKVIVYRQRRGSKNPAAWLLFHHFFEFIRHRKRRQREGEMAGGAFIPVAEAVYVPAFIFAEVVVSVALLQPINDPAKTRVTKEILNFFIMFFPPYDDFMINHFFTN